MSLDPSWISTIFGLIILIGEVISAMCFAIVVERILFNYKPMSEMLKPDFVHDHGKWILAFIMVWAYFSFSQWLIIWAGNLPAEITFYLKRINDGWGYVAAVPRALPLLRSVRDPALAAVQARHPQTGVARGVAAVHALCRSVLDHRAQLLENFHGHHRRHRRAHRHRLDLDLSFFCRNLASLPLLPVYDAYRRRSLPARTRTIHRGLKRTHE